MIALVAGGGFEPPTFGLWGQPKKRQHYISTTWRRRERQKVIEKTPKQSYRTTVGPRFFFWIAVLQRVVFCQSRLLRAVSLRGSSRGRRRYVISYGTKSVVFAVELRAW